MIAAYRPTNFAATTTAILSQLDLPSEYAALGLEITGRIPNASGWIAARAIGRDDRTPSAAIHVASGYYVDKGGVDSGGGGAANSITGGASLSFWDFAVRHGTFADWKAARTHYAEKAGVPLSKKHRQPKNPSTQFAWGDWNDNLAALWCRHKPGVTVESLRAAGARLGHWPAKSKQHPIIAVPAYGPRLLEADPVNYIYWHRAGRELPVYGKPGPDGKPRIKRSAKQKTARSGGPGLVGYHALARLQLAAPDAGAAPTASATTATTAASTAPAPPTPITCVWKTAGPTDMLALWSAIPPDLRDTHLVVTTAFGEGEIPTPEIAALFTGLTVYIVHDADVAGELGAVGWFDALKPVVSEIRHVRLPFRVAQKHGKDLRDWIHVD